MRREGCTSGDDWTDFNLIAVVEHLVLGYEIVAFDDQMRFDDEVQLAQEILHLLRAFDFYRSGQDGSVGLAWGIRSRRYMGEQGALACIIHEGS